MRNKSHPLKSGLFYSLFILCGSQAFQINGKFMTILHMDGESLIPPTWEDLCHWLQWVQDSPCNVDGAFYFIGKVLLSWWLTSLKSLWEIWSLPTHMIAIEKKKKNQRMCYWKKKKKVNECASWNLTWRRVLSDGRAQLPSPTALAQDGHSCPAAGPQPSAQGAGASHWAGGPGCCIPICGSNQ